MTLEDFAEALGLTPAAALRFLTRNPQCPRPTITSDVVTFDDDTAANSFIDQWNTILAAGWRPAQDVTALSSADFAGMANANPGPHYSPVGDDFLDD
jgi:hypothetical protein